MLNMIAKELELLEGKDLKLVNLLVDDMLRQMEHSLRKVKVNRILCRASKKLETKRWGYSRHFNLIQAMDKAGY